jgi:probable HAF family extracellular repeat protein
MEAWSVLSRLLPLILLAGASGWGNAAEARYTITDFGPKTSAVRINAAGEVTGTRSLPSGDFRAFLFSRGQLHDLGTLGGASSVPTGLNDDGTVVGNSRTSEQGPNGNPVWRPFVYKGGVMRELTVIGLNPEVRLDRIFDINNGGVVVGLTDERPRRLCIVSDGRATVAATLAEYTPPDFISGLEIKRINAAGQIIGMATAFQMKQAGPNSSASTNERWHAFVYRDGRMADLGGFFPSDINASGQMVGGRKGEEGKGRSVLYDGEKFHELGTPPGFESGFAAAINAAGQIVGTGSTNTGRSGFLWIEVKSHAFIREQGQWKDLNDLVRLEGTGLTALISAKGINDHGQIICQAMGKDGYRAVLLTPVEPAKP